MIKTLGDFTYLNSPAALEKVNHLATSACNSTGQQRAGAETSSCGRGKLSPSFLPPGQLRRSPPPAGLPWALALPFRAARIIDGSIRSGDCSGGSHRDT